MTTEQLSTLDVGDDLEDGESGMIFRVSEVQDADEYAPAKLWVKNGRHERIVNIRNCSKWTLVRKAD